MPLPLKTIETWNRRLHYYVGLALLPFLGLFALSGLLLNHPEWSFAEFWPGRHEGTFQHAVRPPSGAGDLEKARDVMRQLNVSGEIQWTTTYPEPGRFDFRVARPGRILEIKTDLKRDVATIKRIQTNGWGVVYMLHTFTGVRAGEPGEQRDWILTMVWSAAMDAIAAGLLLMALGSLWMWYRLKPKRRLGVVVLAAGILTCGFFVAGLRWLS